MAVRKAVEIANQLRKSIMAGVYGSEGGLPELREIASDKKTSVNTVMTAVAILETEGLVVKRGHTYYVNPQSAVAMTEYTQPVLTQFTQRGKVGFVENVVPVAVTRLPDEIADLLKVDRGTLATFRFRISGEIIEGQRRPFKLSKYYYILPLNEGQVQELRDDPNMDLLVKYASPHLVAHDKNLARMVTREEAELLKVPEDTPVLQVYVITKDSDGNLLLYQDLVSVDGVVEYDYSFENRPK